MKYLARIQAGHAAPQALEALFAVAVQENGAAEFRDDIDAAFAAAPSDVLLAAWHYRLASVAPSAPGAPAASAASAASATPISSTARPPIDWARALPLSLLTGLSLWWLSDTRFVFHDAAGHTEPFLTLAITPVIALIALAFFASTRKQGAGLLAALGAALAAVTAYATWRSMGGGDYRPIAMAHMPVLAWAAAGACLMGAGAGTRASARNRFAFLAKSIEVTVVTGLYAIAAMIFAAITMGMFKTLGIPPGESVSRLLMIGGPGLMPIVAIATVYDPASLPEAQDFRRGISKMVTTLPRLMLALTLVVLVVYVVLIPANFMQPFRDRNALITYNAMLFAVMGLLVGATPVFADDLSEQYQTWLRRGIVAVAALVLLVGLYALAAVVYRTVNDRLTINRLTVIGWNIINLGVLATLLYRQLRHGRARWIESLHATFSGACVAYLGWALCVTLVTPWLF